MSNRIADFFSKNVKEAWNQTKAYYKENPTRGNLVIAGGLLGSLIDPQAPIGVPAAMAAIEADKRIHERTMEDIRKDHAEGKSLDKYKLKLENFSADRIKEGYTKDKRGTRLTRIGGAVTEILATGGLGAAITAGYAAHRARQRDKLARELEAQSGPKI